MSTAATSSSSSRPPTSPPPSIISPSTTTAPAATTGTAPALHSTLPSPDQQRHIREARAAVVATMENTMDSELQWRASTLHANAGVLRRQAADVQRATAGLRREREKLAREVDAAARRVKELGNVQNWAEVLETDFLVLEETVRLARRRGSCSCSCSDCGGSSGDSGSEAGSDDERGRMEGIEEEGREGVDGEDAASGSGKEGVGEDVAMVLDDETVPGTWSDASRSLTEQASSTGTGRAKSNDTASVSTTS